MNSTSPTSPETENLVAVVMGVGPSAGLGGAICRRFAKLGLTVMVAGRTEEKIAGVAGEISAAGGSAIPLIADATDTEAVRRLFDAAESHGRIDASIFNAGGNWPIPFLELTPERIEEFWRTACLGGFIFAQEALRRMLPAGRGTLLFTGASASMRGRPNFSHFSAPKAGLRMLSQSLAREFGPQGIHVGHVVVDGGIDGERLNTLAPQMVKAKGEDGMLSLEGLADLYEMLYRQPRAAWSLEVDARPFKEPF
ncbi:MAG: SDR family NAD(P)-dependent oxidoreductase [Gammaproteobacteria bacterium AqS3]|nr:SDR family NAD(P)-dependent oxidoreductase [Gammaproteobacteria bacterium AqS3]